MKTKLLQIIITTLVLTTVSIQAQSQNGSWDTNFITPGVSAPLKLIDGNNASYINDILVTESDVFITGRFTSVEGVLANSIARWDGENWHALGLGLTLSTNLIGEGFKLLKDGDSLYVVGSFAVAGTTLVNNIALWDITTQSWSTLGGGLDGPAFSLAKIDTVIYAGGDFERADNNLSPYAAKWDGHEWSEIAPNIIPGSEFNAPVHAIEAGENNEIYFGGEFTSINEEPISHIVKFSNNVWEAFNNPPDGPVYTIKPLGNDSLLVGGDFDKFGSTDAKNIGYWDGTNWFGFPDSPDSTVYSIEGDFDYFHIGGKFSNIGNNPFVGIASSANGEWVNIGSFDTNFSYDGVFDIAKTDSGIIVGGNFDVIEKTVVGNLAFLNTESEWDNFGSNTEFNGINGIINTIAVDEDEIYVGGVFFTAGDKPISHLAKWNGSEWEKFGSIDKTGFISDILIHRDSIYVTGRFNFIDGIPAANFALFDKKNEKWHAPGHLNDFGIDMTMYQDSLIIVGGFTNVQGNVPANGGIAAFHPETNSWKGLLGLENRKILSVEASKKEDDTFFAGGSFDLGFTKRTYNPTDWANFGNLNGSVFDFHDTDSVLYFAGYFQSINGLILTPLHNIGSFSESRPDIIRQVGRGLNGAVHSLTSKGDTLFAGGWFTNELFSPVNLNRIAMWDGNEWAPLGEGISVGTVYALASTGNHIYAGGEFNTAGGVVSNGFARWTFNTNQPTSNEDDLVRVEGFSLKQNYPNPFNPSTTITFTTANSETVALEVFNILGQKVAVLLNEKVSAGQHSVKFDASNLSSGIYMYRLTTDSRVMSKRMLLIK